MRDARVQFDTRTPFSLEIRARVDEYFERTGKARDGGTRMVLKSLFIMTWLTASYLVYMLTDLPWWGVALAACSTGFAMAGVGFSIQHDGGHVAYSSKKWGNRLSAASLDLLGASSYVWKYKHGVVHHTYPNIEGIDDDIELQPLARMAPSQPHYWFHRAQHLYLFVLYAFIGVKWAVYDDYRELKRGYVGNCPIKRPKGLELAIFVGGKLAYYTWFIVLPIAVHGWQSWLLYYALANACLGVSLSVVFQLAHCVDDADFVDPAESDGVLKLDFARHQIATTVDFAKDNKFVTWWVGGLNYQVIHHLFPRVCHLHYPDIAPIVKQVCEEHGVRYRTSPTFWKSVGSHYRWLRTMGKGEELRDIVRPPTVSRAA